MHSLAARGSVAVARLHAHGWVAGGAHALAVHHDRRRGAQWRAVDHLRERKHNVVRAAAHGCARRERESRSRRATHLLRAPEVGALDALLHARAHNHWVACAGAAAAARQREGGGRGRGERERHVLRGD
jgi:hypothetical protein